MKTSKQPIPHLSLAWVRGIDRPALLQGGRFVRWSNNRILEADRRAVDKVNNMIDEENQRRSSVS